MSITERRNRIQNVFSYMRGCGMAKTQTDIAERMKASRSNVSAALNGDEKFLTDNFLRRLNKAYGGLFNDEWLISGTGNMLASDDEEPFERIGSDAKLLPLLPISAMGGTLNDFVVSVKEQDCEKIVSPIKDVDFAITVSGDSMAPEYPSGSICLIKKINEKAFIDWGKVYVLDTCNGVLIKILTPSKKEGCVRCLSINPDPIYAPFDIEACDIYGIYRVKLCMSAK